MNKKIIIALAACTTLSVFAMETEQAAQLTLHGNRVTLQFSVPIGIEPTPVSIHDVSNLGLEESDVISATQGAVCSLGTPLNALLNSSKNITTQKRKKVIVENPLFKFTLNGTKVTFTYQRDKVSFLDLNLTTVTCHKDLLAKLQEMRDNGSKTVDVHPYLKLNIKAAFTIITFERALPKK